MSRGSIRVGGVRLSYLDSGQGPPVLVLHGFTGSGAAMGAMSRSLCERRRVISPDLVGHGHSEAPADVALYSVESMSSQLGELLAALEIDSIDVIGYSMGGRLALNFVVDNLPLVRRLVLIGTTAGLEAEDERRQRVAADDAIAAQIEAEGLEAFVDYWETLPIFGTQSGLDSELRQQIRAGRLSNTASGLANSLRGAGTGVMAPIWHRLGQIETPTLVVAGELDTRYVTLGRRLLAEMPEAILEVVGGAGHAVHVEAPDRCCELVEGFLSS